MYNNLPSQSSPAEGSERRGPAGQQRAAPIPARARSLPQGLPIALRAAGGRHPLLLLTARGAGAGREGEWRALGGAEGILALSGRWAEELGRAGPAAPGATTHGGGQQRLPTEATQPALPATPAPASAMAARPRVLARLAPPRRAPAPPAVSRAATAEGEETPGTDGVGTGGP